MREAVEIAALLLAFGLIYLTGYFNALSRLYHVLGVKFYGPGGDRTAGSELIRYLKERL